jgi:multiple sugar transport system permease protein
VSSIAEQRPRGRSRGARAREALTGWAFVLPACAVIIGLALFPVVYEAILSTKGEDGFVGTVDVGGANYRTLVDDPEFRDAIVRSLIFIALYVPLTVVIGLALALVLNKPLRGMGIYRTCMFVPFVASAAATGVVFRYILDPQYGLLNNTIAMLGFDRQGLIEDPHRALYVMVPIAMWSAVGFDILLFLAALQDVPPELTEAARIDGAGTFSVFRHVVLPALRPVMLLAIVWETINALQVFDVIYATTRGGPVDSTTTLIVFAYRQAFENRAYGYGAAAGVSLFVGILLLTILQIAYTRRRRLDVF